METLLYDVIDGIRVYDGTTEELRIRHANNIQMYSDHSHLFGPLMPSTLTAQGMFLGVTFDESVDFGKLPPPTNNILHIGCNFGELANPSPPIPIVSKAKKTSNRGRKKTRRRTTRKIQGSGAYFNSQITFQMYCTELNKVYQIKLFRNGCLQCPGVCDKQMRDLIPSLLEMAEYLRHALDNPEIRVEYLMSVMRNYTCRLLDPELRVFLDKLERAFLWEKSGKGWIDEVAQCVPSEVLEYTNPNIIDMAEVQNNCERYFGLTAKFRRPHPLKPCKKTTIKVLKSGKVNFDGCNSELGAIELYHWLQVIYERYYAFVIYDPRDPMMITSSEGESIYDEDLSSSSEEEAAASMQVEQRVTWEAKAEDS
jgi:hypothetical protein